MRSCREKVFGPGRAIPLDRNAKCRVEAYAKAWSRLHAQPGQHRGPVTRAFLDVLSALLWGFHNSRTGVCFPSYERIAEKAECSRTTVYEALKVFEWAGVLSWQHRITRIRERCRDLWGHEGWRWRVIRTSNAYVFRDPASEFGNRTGTQNQEDLSLSLPAPACGKPPTGPVSAALERALARLGGVLAAKDGIEQGAAG